jgi:hypothetical protein
MPAGTSGDSLPRKGAVRPSQLKLLASKAEHALLDKEGALLRKIAEESVSSSISVVVTKCLRWCNL